MHTDRKWDWGTALPPPTPESVRSFEQIEFLNGLRSWFHAETGDSLSNYLLAELALVSLNTAEGWRTAKGLATHRELSARDRIFLLFRIMHHVAHIPKKTTRNRAAHAYRWTECEDRILSDEYRSLGPQKLTELLPGRSIAAIKLRAAMLGLQLRNKSAIKWDEEMDSRLRRAYAATGEERQRLMGSFSNIPRPAVMYRARVLGLQRIKVGAQVCPVCQKPFSNLKPHLIRMHGWTNQEADAAQRK
ncbi:Uncharacterized protein ChrSV_2369 [Chromobacterium vaccinii]|nr:Uncharacterized protein ChrSW_2369 [Chromobacterium vaccinii]QND89826.1 Uncharacterized protein ChrSV_2369 [Chromobacterium vaccinii]